MDELQVSADTRKKRALEIVNRRVANTEEARHLLDIHRKMAGVTEEEVAAALREDESRLPAQ
ncbi:hypothetical protein AYO38_10240 [bacterium SCGC AG-212-C10]|nr:hypothetical protein AYO38_10240 [bacterium SCGC AG-212-C10]